MTQAVYEFPLKEKVRNYLRIEQILAQIKAGAAQSEGDSQRYFFEQLFTLLDLFDRLDLRTDIIKDLDSHEKNLVVWSQHPQIDNNALQQTLRSIVHLRDTLKTCKKFGTALKEDKFLASIKQRFSIPGGTCNFDLPNLYFWLQQPLDERQANMRSWLDELAILDNAISIALSFLRERGKLQPLVAKGGFYQGVAEDKVELIRVECDVNGGYYPTLSGNKYRFALRFLWFSPSENQSSAVESDIQFAMANC